VRYPATHPVADTLDRFLLGKLGDAEHAAVEEHLGACPECVERVASGGTPDPFVDLLAAAGTAPDTGLTQSALPTPSLLTVTRPGNAARAPAPVEPPDSLAAHPKYRVRKRLGAGGMGTVWLAEHAVMGRDVAVKVIRPELLSRPGTAERFLREVRAVAKLHHPHIVAAFDAETVDDSCLLVMEYVEGQTLAQRLKECGPLPVAEACRAARDAARGLAHAHAAGLVHRDVKPHNLMRAADGTVKVLDFGLAVVGAPDGSAPAADGLTGAGVVCGTPDYIAPEQIADAHAADARSDVYGLGCTLYHLLAGRPPFAGRSLDEKFAAHYECAPEPITGLPPAVAAVLARMLEKHPDDRFQTAAEVAAALEPFCEPVAPKRRKRRAVAVGLGMLAAAVLAAGVWVIVRDKDGREIARVQVPDGGSVDVKPAAPAEPKKDAPTTEPKKAEVPVVEPAFATRWADGERFGQNALSPDGRFVAVARMGVEKVRVWDVRTGKQTAEVFGAVAQFTPNGRQLVVTNRAGGRQRVGGVVAVYDVAADGSLKAARAFDTGVWLWGLRMPATGTRALAYSAGRLSVWDWQTGTKLFEQPWDDKDRAALTPDGKTVLIAPDRKPPLRALDAATGKPAEVPAGLKGAPSIPQFSADGARALCGDDRGHVVLDVATGRTLFARKSPLDEWAALTGDGRRLVTPADRDGLAVFGVDTGARVATLKLSAGLSGWNDAIPSLDGRAFAFTGPRDSVTLFDLSALPPPAVPEPPVITPAHVHRWTDGGRFGEGDVSADGRYVMAARFNVDTARVWDARTGKPVADLQGAFVAKFAPDERHVVAVQFVPGSVFRVFAFVPGGTSKQVREFDPKMTVWNFRLAEGTRLAAVGPGTFRVYDWQTGAKLFELPWDESDRTLLTPDGQYVFAQRGGKPPLRVYDVATGKPTDAFAHLKDVPRLHSFSADGSRLLCGDGRTVSVLDTRTGRTLFTHERPFADWAVMTGDGRRVVTTTGERDSLVVLDVDSGKRAATLMFPLAIPGGRLTVDASRDGRTIAFAGPQESVFIFDLSGGSPASAVIKPAAEPVGERMKLIGPGHSVPAVAFAPDGKTLLTASAPRGEQAANSDVVLWDAATGTELRRLKGHSFAVYGAAFSADGKRVVTGAGYLDGTVRVWDAGTGQELTQIVYPFADKAHGVYTVAFSPDGKRVYTAAEDKTVRAWDSETGKELLAFEGHPDVVRCLALSPDGKVLASGGAEDRPAVRLWDAATGKELRTFDGHAEQVNAVAFSADGTRLASADCAGSVRVWDVRTGKELKVLEGHTGRVDGLAFTPGGRLITGGSDRTVRVWNPEAGKELARFDGHTSVILSLAVSPCGRFALTGSDDNSARLWRLPEPAPAGRP
jgi:WD40 repeat protein/tRNA A-37 threonylcarbamoyl transferase component Bud32